MKEFDCCSHLVPPSSRWLSLAVVEPDPLPAVDEGQAPVVLGRAGTQQRITASQRTRTRRPGVLHSGGDAVRGGSAGRIQDLGPKGSLVGRFLGAVLSQGLT